MTMKDEKKEEMNKGRKKGEREQRERDEKGRNN